MGRRLSGTKFDLQSAINFAAVRCPNDEDGFFFGGEEIEKAEIANAEPVSRLVGELDRSEWEGVFLKGVDRSGEAWGKAGRQLLKVSLRLGGNENFHGESFLLKFFQETAFRLSLGVTLRSSRVSR